jgi:cellulose synthase/poly-beta-1,6-N-acetylglucosamine synthase-like glycosyltransferase
VPLPDFLRRALPVFADQPRLAMVQGRWEHLNHDRDSLTQAEGLALDAYFGVEQFARSRLNLIMNFNGSAGVWRRAAIEDAGGWQADTLSEDLDLSFRAQLKGWKLTYRPELAAPAELPTTLAAYKRQQARWAQGSFQVLRKLGARIVSAPWPLRLRVQGILALSGYVPHLMMVLLLLLSLPMVLSGAQLPPAIGYVGLAGLGPVLMTVVGQLALRRDWPRRLVYLPALILTGIGLAAANTHAAWQAFFGEMGEFTRTPKTPGGQTSPGYTIPLHWTTWAEAFLAGYALLTGLLAVELRSGLATMAFVYALAFGYTAALGFLQAERHARSIQSKAKKMGRRAYAAPRLTRR